MCLQVLAIPAMILPGLHQIGLSDMNTDCDRVYTGYCLYHIYLNKSFEKYHILKKYSSFCISLHLAYVDMLASTPASRIQDVEVVL